MSPRERTRELPSRKPTNGFASGEKVVARAGFFLPTRGYHRARVSVLQALIFFYLAAVVVGYLFPTAKDNLFQGIHFSAFVDLDKSNGDWLLPGHLVDADAYLTLADRYQAVLKQMLEVKC